MKTGLDRFGLAGVLLCVALLLWGCTQPPDPAVIRFGLASAPTTLDPRHATDAASARVNRLLYARLVDFDERMRPVPALAHWVRETPTRYRFVLRADRRPFSDGRRLTAADVAATYRYVLDPANGSPHRGSLALIERIEVLDEDSLRFHLNRADPLFPGYLVIGIVPADVTGDLARRPRGSGPFELVAWPDAGRLRLRRRDDGQQVELIEVKNATVRALKLRRGEIDLLQNDLDSELIAWLERQPGIRVERSRGNNFAYLGFNLEDPVTGRLKVRQAIARAIDREAIIRYLLAGAARPAGGLLPPDHWAGNPELTGIEHDPAAARALLAELGHGPEQPLPLVYKTSSDPFRIRIATVLQEQLSRVGFSVALRSYDWGTFYGDIKAGRFQMYSLAWVGIKTPDIFRYVFHSTSIPPAGANRGRYRDPVADALIEAAERAGDLDSQAVLYRKLQARLLQTLPYVPLWYEDNVLAVREDIAGYRLALDGNYDGLIDIHRR